MTNVCKILNTKYILYNYYDNILNFMCIYNIIFFEIKNYIRLFVL